MLYSPDFLQKVVGVIETAKETCFVKVAAQFCSNKVGYNKPFVGGLWGTYGTVWEIGELKKFLKYMQFAKLRACIDVLYFSYCK